MKYLSSHAEFSKCGLYRWSLKRTWKQDGKTLLFLGLNPSKASLSSDDATLRRLFSFGNYWGYGSLVVLNLFARVSRSPQILRRCSDPVGMSNDDFISAYTLLWAENSSWDLWLGWGDKGVWRDRNIQVINLLERLRNRRANCCPQALGPQVIGFTRAGNPCHPLYISRKEILKPFIWKC